MCSSDLGALGADTDVLTDTTLLFRLAFPGNDVSNSDAFSTDLTSSCHSSFPPYLRIVACISNNHDTSLGVEA